MNSKIEIMPSYRIVYMRKTGPYGACLVIEDDYKIIHHDIEQGNTTGGKYIVFEVSHTA